MSEENTQNGENAEIPAPVAGALDLAQSFEIERTQGAAKVKVAHFPALIGWDIRRQYREYLESKDANLRMGFTLLVLSYATIENDNGNVIALNEFNAVNENLEHWKNVEAVFSAVLGYNGIKTDAAEEERRRWQVAGEDMAASFLASVSSLIGPALTLAAGKPKEDA